MSLLFVLFLMALLLQATIAKFFPAAGYIDLPLIATMYYALYRGRVRGAIVGTMAGLIADLLSGTPLGVNGFAKTLVGYLVAGGAKRFDLESHMAKFALFVLCALTNVFAMLSLLSIIGLPASTEVSRKATWQGLASAVVGVALVIVVEKLGRRKLNKK